LIEEFLSLLVYLRLYLAFPTRDERFGFFSSIGSNYMLIASFGGLATCFLSRVSLLISLLITEREFS
jgi:hypothetical protein